MKKLYKYLAVAACALLGVGSATAAAGPDKMYLSSNRGGDWSNGPTLMTTADNKNDVYEFKGLPFVKGEKFVLSNAKFSSWSVDTRYTTEEKNDVSFDGDLAGKFTEGTNGCWIVNVAGIYDISINFTTSTIGITQVATDLSHVYRLNSAITTGSNSWQIDIMTYNNGIWEYTGTLNEGQFGIQECTPEDGKQSKWMGGACTINEANTAVSFSNIQDSANSQSNLSGVYTIKYDPSDNTIEFSNSQGGSTGGDITLDDHGTTYATTPQLTDLLLAYWVGTQTPHSNSHKYVEFTEYAQGSLTGTKFGWAKYEDTGDYESWMIEAGDTDAITANETAEHDCRNFNDAYYRFYVYNLNSRPDLKNVAVQTTSIRTPRAVPAQGIENSRVARTFPMKDNTTGVDDIVTDGGTSVEDTNAPVIWYNLQGQRVNNPSGGVFIRQQGSKVTKEYIR